MDGCDAQSGLAREEHRDGCEVRTEFMLVMSMGADVMSGPGLMLVMSMWADAMSGPSLVLVMSVGF